MEIQLLIDIELNLIYESIFRDIGKFPFLLFFVYWNIQSNKPHLYLEPQFFHMNRFLCWRLISNLTCKHKNVGLILQVTYSVTFKLTEIDGFFILVLVFFSCLSILPTKFRPFIF